MDIRELSRETNEKEASTSANEVEMDPEVLQITTTLARRKEVVTVSVP